MDLHCLALFISGFASGFLIGYFINRLVRSLVTVEPSNQGIRLFLLIAVTVIWFTANILSWSNGKPVDISLHGIFGAIIGAYFVDLKYFSKGKDE